MTKAKDELTYGIDMGTPKGDMTALSIKKGKHLYSFVGADAEVILEFAAQQKLDLLTRLEKQAIKDMKKNLGQYGTLVRDSIPLNVIKSERALIEKRMM